MFVRPKCDDRTNTVQLIYQGPEQSLERLVDTAAPRPSGAPAPNYRRVSKQQATLRHGPGSQTQHQPPTTHRLLSMRIGMQLRILHTRCVNGPRRNPNCGLREKHMLLACYALSTNALGARTALSLHLPGPHCALLVAQFRCPTQHVPMSPPTANRHAIVARTEIWI